MTPGTKGEAARPSIFVIDDDDAMRATLVRLLSMSGYDVRSFASAQTFLRLPLDALTGCIIIDVRMPDLDGLALQREIREADLDLPVIFISGYADIPLTVRAMREGAFTFLTKPFREQDLLDAIRDAVLVEREGRGARLERRHARDAVSRLDERERQILMDVADGALNKTIAQRLGLSEISIKVLRARMMRKLGATSIVQLARMVERLRK